MKHKISIKAVRDFAYVLAAAFLLASLVVGMLPVGQVSASKGGNPGAIWTTNGDCGDASQDVNHFATGDVVYINGSGFDDNTSYDWQIKGQPGGASADPNIIVASGSVTTDGDGNFCFAAYTIAADDDGEYSVKVGNKGDNYRVEGSTPPPVDVCPNLDGTQTAVPDGMKVDQEGNCVPLEDPLGLEFYCLGFTVTNLNDFETTFNWQVEGGPSGSALLDVGESIDIDVDAAFAGAQVTISVDNPQWSLSGNLPDDCPVRFIDLQIAGFCLAANNASLYGWRVTNPNGYDVDFEWRVNGSTLADVATVGANGTYEFTTPKAEGNIIMLYLGGVFQSDATGAQCTDDVPTVPENTPIEVGGGGGGPVLIPVTGGGTPVLIPVTGVANDRVDLTPRVFLNLGFGFFGLGLVLHGLSRRKGAL